MGERLVINVFQKKEDENPLYNIYYHWSGYPDVALKELLSLIENGYKTIPEAVKFITSNGGSIVAGDIDLYEKQYNTSYQPLKYASRNQGLLSISIDSINIANQYGEHIIDVYLDENEFNIEHLFLHINENINEYDNHDESTNIKFNNSLSIDTIIKLHKVIQDIQNRTNIIKYNNQYYLI